MLKPKLIYLARRNLLLDRAAFIARWRQHGALGMSMPRWKNIWRYAHCDVLADGDGVEHLNHGHDGVGIVWHRNPDARRAHRNDHPSQGEMEQDELATFAELVRNFCALYEADMIVDVAPRRGIKLFRFVERKPEVPIDTFLETMTSLAPGVMLRDPDMRDSVNRYVQNQRLPPEALPWGLEFDLVEELWFDDVAAALRAHRAIRENAPLNRMGAQLISRTLTLLTNEVVLYETSE